LLVELRLGQDGVVVGVDRLALHGVLASQVGEPVRRHGLGVTWSVSHREVENANGQNL
jgi:hypothetical protein